MADQKACHAGSTVGLLCLVEELFHMHEHSSTQVRVADTETILRVAWVVLVQIVIMDLVEIIGATAGAVVEGLGKPRFALMECEEGSVTLGLHEPSQAYECPLVEDGVLRCLLDWPLCCFRVVPVLLGLLIIHLLRTLIAHLVVMGQDLDVQPQSHGLAITWLPVLDHEQIAMPPKNSAISYLDCSKRVRLQEQHVGEGA